MLSVREGKTIHQGTIVILSPPMAQTLRLVIVLTNISTKPVKQRPIRECTVSMRLMEPEKKMKNTI